MGTAEQEGRSVSARKLGLAREVMGPLYEPRSQAVPMGTVGVVVARMDLGGREYDPEEPVPCEKTKALLKLRFLNGRRPGPEAWYTPRELRRVDT